MIAANAVQQARKDANTVVILDTAGRLHIDEPMMRELQAIEQRVKPHEVLLVADAMTGQDAVHTAEEFHKSVHLTGLVLTKMDGDARGGAALSIRPSPASPSSTWAPVKDRRPGAVSPRSSGPAHPGHGRRAVADREGAAEYHRGGRQARGKKMRTGTFNLEDFLQQMQQVRKMGSLSQIMGMIPGMRNVMREAGGIPDMDDKEIKRIEAIITSMTMKERQNPTIIDGSRRRRIARGSGTTVQEVNQLLNQFKEMQKMMKQLTSGKMRLPKG
jgi:signal recognition particle subunit SRP54